MAGRQVDGADSAVGQGDRGDPVDGTVRTIDLPPGVPGHSPVVGLNGDRLTVDGVPVGGSLRGPAGAPGAPGGPGAIATHSSYLIVGPGRPDQPETTGGIITGSEPVGAEYRSTDGAGVGAWAWKKDIYYRNWSITWGDTGSRELDISATWPEYPEGTSLLLRRVGNTVTVRPGRTNGAFAWDMNVANAGAGFFEFPLLGFGPDSRVITDIYTSLNDDFGTKVGSAIAIPNYGTVRIGLRHDAAPQIEFELRWTTAGWPTTLPGTPG